MSARAIRILAIAVLVLFAAVWLIDRQRDAAPAAGELLFPGLAERLDRVSAIEVTDADGSIRIVRDGDRWVVPAKDGYSADVAKLRELLLGLAEARKIEQKTSSPELYARIGVQDIGQKDAAGVLVASQGLEGGDFAVILGNSAQRDYRYVRVPGQATSWLIDRNPEVPDDTAGWLVSDIADIASSRVQSVTIRHEDGETIRIRKVSEEATNFTVEDIPDGRELSYPSVANGMAGALDNLAFDDVRAARQDTAGGGDAPANGQAEAGSDGDSPAPPTRATTVFRTFDGLEITVESTGSDDETWIRLAAAARAPAEDTGQAGPQEGGTDVEPATAAASETAAEGGSAPRSASDEAQAGSGTAAEEDATPAAAEQDATAAEDALAAEAPEPGAEAAELNARVSGWEFRIPQYKASQLRRHWEDLLRAPESAEE